MTNKNIRIALLVAISAAPLSALAQIRPTYQFPPLPSESGPATIQLGASPFYIAPFARFGVGRDDNVLLQAENERSSTVYLLEPGFTVDARGTNQVLQFQYLGQIGRYAQSKEDDYADHTVRSQYDVAFDRRNFLRVGLDYFRGHEPRGSTDRGIGVEPDEYRLVSPNATYAFGAPGALGRVELYYAGADRRYLNNRAVTRDFDRKTHEGGGALYWRVGPKTQLLAEARMTDIQYRVASAFQRDSEERRYFGGVSWEATAATSATIKIGRLEKRFDSGIPDHSSTAWEATLGWAPRTYSRFDLFASRTTNESTGLGNFILTDLRGVNWTHAWSSFFSTGLSLRYQKDEYQGFDRTDDTRLIGLKVDYKMRRWLTFGAEYIHSRRDSTLPTSDYDKNLYFLTATATM
jgi:polysaccharide biosynthesis protein VpsM